MITEEEEFERLCTAAHDWRLRVETGDAEDRAALDAWLAEDLRHEEAYDRALTYSAALTSLRPQDLRPEFLEPLEDEQLPGLVGRLRLLARGPTWVFGGAFALLLMTATALFLASAHTGPESELARFETARSERRTVELTDGSRVILDAATRLEFAATADSRRATLTGGAALFEVAPDAKRPFTVAAADLRATALGTVFDIRSNGGVQRVAVAEGAVRVSYPTLLKGAPVPTRSSRELAAGEQVRASAKLGLGAIAAIEPNAVGAWREDRLIYESASLAEIVADANRYSNVPIVIEAGDELAERTLSGTFFSSDLDGLLTMLSLSLPLEVDRSEASRIRVVPREQKSSPQGG